MAPIEKSNFLGRIRYNPRGGIEVTPGATHDGFAARQQTLRRLHFELHGAAQQEDTSTPTHLFKTAQYPQCERAKYWNRLDDSEIEYVVETRHRKGRERTRRHLLTVEQTRHITHPRGILEVPLRQGLGYLTGDLTALPDHVDWLAAWREMRIPRTLLQHRDWQTLARSALRSLIFAGERLQDVRFATTRLARNTTNVEDIIPDFTTLLDSGFFMADPAHLETQDSDVIEPAVFRTRPRPFVALWLGKDATGFWSAIRLYMRECELDPVNPYVLEMGYLTTHPDLFADWPGADLQLLQDALLPGE